MGFKSGFKGLHLYVYGSVYSRRRAKFFFFGGGGKKRVNCFHGLIIEERQGLCTWASYLRKVSPFRPSQTLVFLVCSGNQNIVLRGSDGAKLKPPSSQNLSGCGVRPTFWYTTTKNSRAVQHRRVLSILYTGYFALVSLSSWAEPDGIYLLMYLLT